MGALYLRCIIREQIDRAESLMAEIPARQRHAAPERLAAACRDMLETQARLLERAGALPGGGGMDGAAAKAMRILKMRTRAIAAAEGYGLPPPHCQSEQAVLLSDALSAMHGEVGLPFPCPAAPCTSGGYYFVHLAASTVHVPLSEAAFLPHMPDFCHEPGRLSSRHVDRGAECRPILDGMGGALGAIGGWYSELSGSRGRESDPLPAKDEAGWMRSRWKSEWMQEASCDLFALFAAGPAYAHSNPHLVSKTGTGVYKLNLLARQDRPSGEAGMRLLGAGMRLLGHDLEADRIRAEWGAMAQPYGGPPPGYGHAFPSEPLQEAAAAVLPTFGRAGLRGYSGGGRERGGSGRDTVAGLPNEAWRGFWRDADCGFRDAEKELISRLAAAARRGVVVR